MPAQPWIAVFPLALAAFACGGFEGGSDVLAESARGELAAATGSDWSCLDRADASANAVAVVDRSRPLPYTIKFIDFVTRQPPPQLAVRACNLADLDCANPVTPFTPSSDGNVTLSLFQGFSGFFEATSPSTIPAVIRQERILTEATKPPRFPYLLVPPEAFVSLVQSVGVTPEPDTGYLGAFSLDCAGNLAGGVHVELVGVETSVTYYLANGLPTTQLDETGADGIAGFLNVPPGTVLVRASLKATGQVISSGSFTIRKNWETGVVIFH